MTTGLLQTGAVQIVSQETGMVIGYAYTVENEGGQLQRWLLYRNPGNAFAVKPCLGSMADWTLADWKTGVQGLWQPDSFYVWAQADAYLHGGTYGGQTWTAIPDASVLPQPNFPADGSIPRQLDPTGFRILDVLQGKLGGLAYSVGGLEDASSVEYWMLPSGYQGAGALGVEVKAADRVAGSLQEFIDVANGDWSSGGLFSITGCVNYRGTVAPAAP